MDYEELKLLKLGAQLAEKPNYKTYYQNMGKAFNTKSLGLGSHASWSHSNVFYDASIDKVVVFYDVMPTHDIINTALVMAKKEPEGSFSTPIVVANRNAEGIATRSQASGLLKNGNYISIVSKIRNSDYVVLGTDVYISTDKGVTWNNSPLIVGGTEYKADGGDVTGCLVLKSGRILLWGKKDGSKLCDVIISDDNGVNWYYGVIAGSPTNHTEPAWCELSDGTIIAYLRNTVGGSYSTKYPAKIVKSIDSGLTWSAPVDSTSILDYVESNGAMVYHEDKKVIEFIHHSRFVQIDGNSSLYLSSASEEDFKNDKFSPQTRISQLPPQASSPVDGDSGYVGACILPNNSVYAFYYTGSHSDSEICYLIGKPEPSINKTFAINELTGVKQNFINLLPYQLQKLYSLGDECIALTGGWTDGYSSGAGKFKTKKANALNLCVLENNIGQIAFRPTNMIDVTNLSAIYVVVDVGFRKQIVTPSFVTPTLRVYSKQNPSTSSDGRLIDVGSTIDGIHVLKADVSNITGNVSIEIGATSSVSGANAINVNVYEVFAETTPYLTSTYKTYISDSDKEKYKNYVYNQGKENTEMYGGLVAGFNTGTGIAQKFTDVLQMATTGGLVTDILSFKTTNAIDISSFNYLVVECNILTGGNTSKIEVTPYSTQNPSGQSDGRLDTWRMLFSTVGKQKSIINIADLKATNPSIYLQIVASKGSTEAGNTNGYIEKIYLI